ncbi:MAG: nuclear transport factor 2 family protein [Vicinamibacterales bacterium]
MRQGYIGALLLIGVLGAAWASAQGGGASLSAQDLAEIQQLYGKYNWAIDAGDIEAYVALYTPDGSFNAFTGANGLRTFMKGRQAGTRRHWNSNLVITPTAEGASGKVYLLLVDVGVKPPAISSAARYEDRLVKTPQGWRFKARRTFADPAPAAQ